MSTRTPDGGLDGERGEDDDASPPSITLQQRKSAEQRTPPTPDVRLYHRAVIVAQEATGASTAVTVQNLNVCRASVSVAITRWCILRQARRSLGLSPPLQQRVVVSSDKADTVDTRCSAGGRVVVQPR